MVIFGHLDLLVVVFLMGSIIVMGIMIIILKSVLFVCRLLLQLTVFHLLVLFAFQLEMVIMVSKVVSRVLKKVLK